MRAVNLPKRLPSATARRRLLVVEGGATVLSPEGADDFDETVALLELEGDEPAEFAERVLRRLATAEHSGQPFAAVLLFVGSACSASAQAARRRVAHGVAAHAAASPQLSELVIVAKPNAPEALRYQLLELADELALHCNQGLLPVRLSFGEPARALASGVFERVTRH